MKVVANPDKLFEFADYVSQFSKNINTECVNLSQATAKLAAGMDAEDVASIQRLSREVAQIVDDAGPTLKELQQKVEGYGNFIIRLQSIARS